jgi:hypothetical protein
MGGGVKPVAYNAQGSNVLKEAEERKHGGKVHHMHGEGHEAKERADRPKRARGGKLEHHEHEHKHEHHMKRATGGSVPGRKRGGGIGADRMPLSSAAKIKEVTKGEMGEDEPKSD